MRYSAGITMKITILVIAVLAFIGINQFIESPRAQAAVIVDQVAPAQTLNEYGSFNACPNSSVALVTGIGGGSSKTIAWTCVDSKSIIRHGRI